MRKCTQELPPFSIEIKACHMRTILPNDQKKSGSLHDALFLQMMCCLLWKVVCHCLFAFVKQ